MRRPRPYDKRRWRDRIQPAQLQREPLCRMHREQGKFIAAVDVDHIVALADGGSFDDPDNLRSLCHECHSRVTNAWMRGKAEPKARVKGVDAETGIPKGGWWQ